MYYHEFGGGTSATYRLWTPEAEVLHVLQLQTPEGHLWIPRTKLISNPNAKHPLPKWIEQQLTRFPSDHISPVAAFSMVEFTHQPDARHAPQLALDNLIYTSQFYEMFHSSDLDIPPTHSPLDRFPDWSNINGVMLHNISELQHVLTTLAEIWGPLRGASHTAKETQAAESARISCHNERTMQG